MDYHKIPIQPLNSPITVYIRRHGRSSRWIAQKDYFFRIPILGAQHGEVKLEPGTPIKLATDISNVYVDNGRILIDWMFEGGYLDITNLLVQDQESGVLRFKDRNNN